MWSLNCHLTILDRAWTIMFNTNKCINKVCMGSINLLSYWILLMLCNFYLVETWSRDSTLVNISTYQLTSNKFHPLATAPLPHSMPHKTTWHLNLIEIMMPSTSSTPKCFEPCNWSRIEHYNPEQLNISTAGCRCVNSMFQVWMVTPIPYFGQGI